MLLTENLTSLSQWIVASRMQVNVGKSSIMWFHCQRSKKRASFPSIYLDGLQVDHYKYLDIFFDPQLRWDIHINHVCKRMSYYLYLISYHRRQLPLQILKMLMDTLVLSQFYALPVWGPSLETAPASRLQHLCNRTVRVTCGLRKYDYVSAARHNLGWLPFDLLVQYRTLVLMHRHYVHDNCVQLDPPLLFGPNHGHNTRQSFLTFLRYLTALEQSVYLYFVYVICIYSCIVFMYVVVLQLLLCCNSVTGKEKRLWPIVRLIINQSIN